MLVRIVRMTFKPEEVNSFLVMFESIKEKIRSFEGCEYLELWRDLDQNNVFVTHSHWQSPEYLEKYRHSELFKSTWAKTKPLFSAKPMAFSVESVTRVL